MVRGGSRQLFAKRLRDGVVPYLARRGRQVTLTAGLSDIRCLTVEVSSFEILYRTPFGGWLPELGARNYAESVLMRPNGRYGLDVWGRGTKLANLEWDDIQGPICVVSLATGHWRNELLALTADCP